MSRVKPSIAKGTRDFSPSEIRRRNFIFDIVKLKFEKFGFRTIKTPIKPNAIADHLLIPINSFKKNFANIDTKKGHEKNKALAVARGM